MPKVSNWYWNDTLFFFPEKRCVKSNHGSLQLVDLKGEPNYIALPSVGIGFANNVWGLCDNEQYYHAKKKTPLSVPSTFNAMDELAVSNSQCHTRVWAQSLRDQERRENRSLIPDAPIDKVREIPHGNRNIFFWTEVYAYLLGRQCVYENKISTLRFRRAIEWRCVSSAVPVGQLSVSETTKEEDKLIKVNMSDLSRIDEIRIEDMLTAELLSRNDEMTYVPMEEPLTIKADNFVVDRGIS